MNSYKQFAKQTLQNKLEKELHKIAQETISEGYGPMTGGVLMMNFSQMQELAIKQFKQQKDQLGLTEQEIVELVTQIVKQVTAIYIQ